MRAHDADQTPQRVAGKVQAPARTIAQREQVALGSVRQAQGKAVGVFHRGQHLGSLSWVGGKDVPEPPAQVPDPVLACGGLLGFELFAAVEALAPLAGGGKPGQAAIGQAQSQPAIFFHDQGHIVAVVPAVAQRPLPLGA